MVLERSRIIDVPRIEDSLIGRERRGRALADRPRALRMMVGDHCRIDIE